MSLDATCRALLAEYRNRPTLRAASLITTVFGDSIAPRGGSLWLGSLIALLADFGISERLVRTSVFRLANDDWLVSEPVGRKSYYSLTETGRDRFRAATQRIYSTPHKRWDNNWCLLLMSTVDAATRDALRKECGWLGFGSLSTNVLAHPAPNQTALEETLQRLHADDAVIVLQADVTKNTAAMRSLAHESWGLDDLARQYESFIGHFSAAHRAVRSAADIAPKTAFLIRTLLIQDYRKLLLRDPQMPADLLPSGWPGHDAYSLCGDIYRATHHAADRYLDEKVETTSGKLPKPAAAYYARFGGLRKRSAAKRSA